MNMKKMPELGKLSTIGTRPPSENTRVIMNAVTGQKIGIGEFGGVTGMSALNVTS